MNEEDKSKKIPTLLSVRDFSKRHPFMSEASIRWLISKKAPGIEECLVRLSRRVYIDEEKFFEFLKKQTKLYYNGNKGKKNA